MQLEHVALVVRDYDAAIAFFVNVLGFELVEDSPALTTDGSPKRWVVVRPRDGQTGVTSAWCTSARSSAPDRRGNALGRGVRALLIRVARSANRVWMRRGSVIAERYHLHRLKTPREARNAIAYVLGNARKHLGDAIVRGRIDPASSARWFWGRATDAPAVALPRFWLLALGWLRHGPLGAPSG